MFELRGREFKLCDGVSRRGFLKIGSLGLGGLTLPRLLEARETGDGLLPGGADKKTAVILFWMAGGPSQIDTYDPKPDQPEEIRGPFSTIATRVPGLSVTDYLPLHMSIADKLAVIRSIHHTHSVHDDGAHWVQTGYPQLQSRERGQNYPAEGSVTASLRGANDPEMPPYVCIPEAYSSPRGFYQRSAYLGAKYDPVNAGGDPKLGNYRLPDFTLPAELTLERLSSRRALMPLLDGLARQADENRFLDAQNQYQQQAFELVLGTKARQAFDVSREPDELKERYGKHAWGHAALLARRLVEAGVTFVTINLYEADVDWWDDHYTIEKNLRKRLPKFDQSFTALIEDLADRGMTDRVMVGAWGEFGRNPRVDSHAGRGHWPGVMSAVMCGGGIKGGQVVGATDARGGAPADRALGPGDLLASVYRVLGIDHNTHLPDRQNRPVRLIETGEPIAELFS
ncbi:MAG: DUF1501 domain-containing protein [Planctomycetota bacterium]|nr:DUF1501 domain-containing protein [Planctomycetota bacterium]MDA1211178.1 DUF1501 domain-containing protein [Planctomycetota bacterium]